MQCFGTTLTRKQLSQRTGRLHQAGGVQLLSLEEGYERGVRMIEFNTGTGFRFRVAADRGFDVATCEYRGASLAWLPPKGFVGPEHFEGGKVGWLRNSGLGGLFNSCGLVTIGGQQELDTSHFGYGNRNTDFYGIHDRIALIPAEHFTFGERWEGDRCFLWAEGLMRQEIAYGENLTLLRRYEAELGTSFFSVVDTVSNEGSYETAHQLLYHMNIGWPVVDQGARLIASVPGDRPTILFGDDGRDPANYRQFIAPEAQFKAQGYESRLNTDAKGWAASAVVNESFDGGRGIGAFVRYDSSTLPIFIEWRMMSEGLYAVGMEPATNGFAGIDALKAAGFPVMLQPGESRTYRLEMGALGDRAAIRQFEAAQPAA